MSIPLRVGIAVIRTRPQRFWRRNGNWEFGVTRSSFPPFEQKLVLQFIYNGKLRTVEPQTYGLSTTGREVLRAYERTIPNGSKRSGMAKLFDLNKISGLRKSGQSFSQALPTHNPDDSAMVEIFATLPVPGK